MITNNLDNSRENTNFAKKKSMEKIPEIGKTYHFFDDGKITMMRHSMATVTRILSIVDAKNEMFNLIDYSDWNAEKGTWENQVPYKISLFQIWRNEVEDCSWIYAPDTDYFVECSIPKFDENPIWFVRTVNGGWFSLDIQSGWQAGRLDIDESLWNWLQAQNNSKK